MYEELVERLRTEGCLPYTTLKTMREAADAIEAMSEYVDTMSRLKCKGWQLKQVKLMVYYDPITDRFVDPEKSSETINTDRTMRGPCPMVCDNKSSTGYCKTTGCIKPLVTEINIFDEIEIHENCTVEILKNSATGQISIGWRENDS